MTGFIVFMKNMITTLKYRVELFISTKEIYVTHHNRDHKRYGATDFLGTSAYIKIRV